MNKGHGNFHAATSGQFVFDAPSENNAVSAQTEIIFHEQLDANHKRTDRMFAWLMMFQWLAGIAVALWISPRAWEGPYSQIHIHVWAALFLGGAISAFPVFLALKYPGSVLTRHAIAVGQMLSCGLLIHLTGGRIETHFQYFVILAFLAFYRDWRVLLTASVVATADHFIRGVVWPQSIFGVFLASPWRAMEHTAWILFEDAVLVMFIRQNLWEMLNVAERQAKLASMNELIERKVDERTSELRKEVAERTLAEETLYASEEKFRQLADNISDVFWMTSPDMRTVHYVSPAYEQVWGRSIESLYAHPQQWTEALSPEDRDRIGILFSSLVTGAPSVSVEYQISRPDGEMRWIHSRGFGVQDGAGHVIRLTGIAIDITERKRTEARLFQSQKMETVGKLAGGVAHEFNSILTAIIGQSELLLSDLPAESPLAKNATEIREAADRAATLTRQLLAYGRKQILQPEIIDLNTLLTGMASTLQHLAGKEVDVRLIPAAGLKAVKIDPGQMEQVIVNITLNAADAMPNGGKFTLETANVTLDEEYVLPFPGLKPGGYVMLAMTDTGVGMSEKVKASVFEPFFSTKGVGQGTGLGLATCHGILKQSDGHIAVYSEIARGSTFKIYLPQVVSKAKIELPRLKPSDLPRGIETILMAEDDPSLLKMSANMLRRLGYTVLTAANGLEALNLKNQRDIGHIDLLFTDIVMPHMSGKELSDRIRAIYPQTKILFTSAYTENAIVHQGVLDKGILLLKKPFTPSALANKVREALDQTESYRNSLNNND